MTKHYTLKMYPIGGGGYRLFCSYWWAHVLNPKHYYRGVKYLLQRGWRGYADCDYWDADGYLEHVMLGVLSELRKHSHGYPQSMSDYDIHHLASDDDAPDTGMEKWRALLTEIIVGLKAAQDLRDEDSIPEGVYSDEPFEFERVPGSDGLLSRIKDTDTPRFNVEKYELWATPLRKQKARASYLLRRYWGAFWD